MRYDIVVKTEAYNDYCLFKLKQTSVLPKTASRAAIFLSRPELFMRWLASAFLTNSTYSDERGSNLQPLDSIALITVQRWLSLHF